MVVKEQRSVTAVALQPHFGDIEMIFMVMQINSTYAFVKTNDIRVAEALVNSANYKIVSRWRYYYLKTKRLTKGA